MYMTGDYKNAMHLPFAVFIRRQQRE